MPTASKNILTSMNRSPPTMNHQLGDSVDHSTPPPVGMVVVRETPPPRDRNSFSGSRSSIVGTSPSSNTACTSTARTVASAFRLQPRGGNSTIIPSPSPAHHPMNGGLAPGDSSGSRKRGAQCLVPSFAASTGIQQRALFPSMTAAAGSSIASPSTPSQSSQTATPPSGEPPGFLPAAASPSRVEHALQSLSLRSPMQTPQSQHQQECWRGSVSSPFHLYGSPSPRTSANIHGRRRVESIGSVVSASSARTPTSVSRSSPRHAPVLILQNEGQHERKASPPLRPGRGSCASYVVSLDSKRAPNTLIESRMTTGTPPLHRPPPVVVQMNISSPDTQFYTPRIQPTYESQPSTPIGHGTPSSKVKELPSPHDTPLPKIKLTPRSSGGAGTSTTAAFSPQDLDLGFSPASAGFLEHHSKNDGMDVSSSSIDPPPPPRRNPTSSNRASSYFPLPDWNEGRPPSSRRSMCHIPPPPSDSGGEKNAPSGDRPPVVIRSLLAPCVPHPSPSLRAMVTADAEAAALDCDGSLTDDDDDDPFVLTDPAILAAERHQHRDDEGRPSQRRRTSIEGDEIEEFRRSSIASQSSSFPGFNQASSSTSLLGMALLRGDSMNSLGNFQSQRRLSNHKIDSSGSSHSSGPSSDQRQKASEEERQLNRIKSDESLNSIGLDLDQSASDLNQKSRSRNSRLSERDLHTPPAMQDDPTARSPKLSRRCPAEKLAAIDGGGASSVYLSRSDPGDVQRTIANMILAQTQQQQQHSPPMACNS